MRSLKKLSLCTVLALAAVALTAASASADIVNSSGTYVGDVQGVNTGPDPTFTTGNMTITCTSATVAGTLDGDWDETGPATAELDFAWDGCTTSGVTCTVQDMTNVPFAITEEPAPDASFRNTGVAATDIACGPGGTVHNCHWSWDPATSPLTIEGDSNTGAWSIDDTGEVSGLGCPTSGRWTAKYLITEPEDDLFATGSQ